MNKKWLTAISVGLLSLSLAACGDNEEKEKKKEEPKTGQHVHEEKPGTAAEVEATGNVVEIVVKGSNFTFDAKEIKVKAGDTVKLTYENEVGGHGLAIDEFNVHIEGGETVEFVANKKGTFEYYCSIMCGTGHDTMVGKLIVE